MVPWCLGWLGSKLQIKDYLETGGFLYSFICWVQVKARLCGAQFSPLWAFIWFVFQLIHLALAQDGEKLSLTVRLPSSCVRLLGAEVAEEPLWCMAVFPRRRQFLFVCFLEVWHLGPLLNPACLGWAYILTPQLPAEVGTAHTFVECVCVCVLTYVGGGDEPRGWGALLQPTGTQGCSVATSTHTQMFSVPPPRRQHKEGILWKGSSEETL